MFLFHFYVIFNVVLNSAKLPESTAAFFHIDHFFLILAVVQSLSRVRLFETPWTAAHQASPSFTISGSLLKLMSGESVMPSSHLILCHPLLLLPSIFPSIRVFSSDSGGQSTGASAFNEVSRLISSYLELLNCPSQLLSW